jgi:putative ABC transport system ATP-binding protein
LIELREITKSYGDITPIEDLSLKIEEGDFISIIGPSGSGKTTLLNIIAGLLTPTRGEINVDGVSLYGLNQRARVAFRRENFGFVFQAFNLIPYLTTIENVEVPLYLAGMKNREQRALASDLLERVGLIDKADRFPTQLSIGEQQRVAIARALANSPKVVFADEPTGNLDTENGMEVMRYIKELNERGVTVLLVTHDSEMAGFAQRKIKLANGRYYHEKQRSYSPNL